MTKRVFDKKMFNFALPWKDPGDGRAKYVLPEFSGPLSASRAAKYARDADTGYVGVGSGNGHTRILPDGSKEHMWYGVWHSVERCSEVHPGCYYDSTS